MTTEMSVQPAPRQVHRLAELEAFWARVRSLTHDEIMALAEAQRSLGGFDDGVPVAFETIASLDYANWAYIETMHVSQLTAARALVPVADSLFADVAIAAKGAAVVARHRLSGRNIDILEAAWRRAGLDGPTAPPLTRLVHTPTTAHAKALRD